MADAEQDLSRAIFDSLDTGLILLDGEQRVALWNGWFAAMCGVSSETAVGQRFDALFPGSKFARLNSAVTAALDSGVSSLLTHSLHPALFPLKTRAGRTLIHDVMVSVIESKPYRLCLIQIVDVTVAAERDRVLRERQNARYDAVVDSAPDVILTLDADGTIQFANPAALDQFGYDVKDLTGKPIGILFPQQSTLDDAFAAIIAGRPIQQPIDVTAARRDGSPSYLEISLSSWRTESRVFVTAILRDVNERRAAEEARVIAARALEELNATLEQRVTERTAQLLQAEESLRQSQKMEAVGQLTGGIAHDFNNLLQGIIGALDRIKKRLAEGRLSDVDRFLTGATASANRAAALTQRLLAFSRRQPVDPRSLAIGELIGMTKELIQRPLGETITMKIDVAPDLWLVRCDVNQLENAFLNLAINARDAMPDGGAFKIACDNVELNHAQAQQREVKAGQYVRVRISDTGVGMPPEVKARAFDPFYTTKPIGQGTGLGLSMIYGFIRQSEGGVTIESQSGRGTTIEICLPRYIGKLDEAVAETDSPYARHTGQDEVVLIVEDEGVVRLLIAEVLNDLGYHALEAADGPAALRILQSNQRIDLLVTDIGLPGLNGRQVADAARIARPDLRVLFMTGYAETVAGSSFLESGMEIITKPFTMDVLALKIRAMITTARVK